jgi:hypothetical protein
MQMAVPNSKFRLMGFVKILKQAFRASVLAVGLFPVVLVGDAQAIICFQEIIVWNYAASFEQYAFVFLATLFFVICAWRVMRKIGVRFANSIMALAGVTRELNMDPEACPKCATTIEPNTATCGYCRFVFAE